MTAPTGTPVQLFCSPDKNQKTLQEELLAKVYFKALREAHPEPDNGEGN